MIDLLAFEIEDALANADKVAPADRDAYANTVARLCRALARRLDAASWLALPIAIKRLIRGEA